MLAWLLERIWNVLTFSLVVTGVFGAYKIVRTIISEGADSLMQSIQDRLQLREVNRIFRKRIGRK